MEKNYKICISKSGRYYGDYRLYIKVDLSWNMEVLSDFLAVGGYASRNALLKTCSHNVVHLDRFIKSSRGEYSMTLGNSTYLEKTNFENEGLLEYWFKRGNKMVKTSNWLGISICGGTMMDRYNIIKGSYKDKNLDGLLEWISKDKKRRGINLMEFYISGPKFTPKNGSYIDTKLDLSEVLENELTRRSDQYKDISDWAQNMNISKRVDYLRYIVKCIENGDKQFRFAEYD